MHIKFLVPRAEAGVLAKHMLRTGIKLQWVEPVVTADGVAAVYHAVVLDPIPGNKETSAPVVAVDAAMQAFQKLYDIPTVYTQLSGERTFSTEKDGDSLPGLGRSSKAVDQTEHWQKLLQETEAAANADQPMCEGCGERHAPRPPELHDLMLKLKKGREMGALPDISDKDFKDFKGGGGGSGLSH